MSVYVCVCVCVFVCACTKTRERLKSDHSGFREMFHHMLLFCLFFLPPETKFLSDPEIIQTGLERQPLVPDKTDIVSNICSMLPHTTAPLC